VLLFCKKPTKSSMPFVSVYVDESGDLGFQKNSSKFFVVSYVMIVNKRIDEIEGLVKRILKNINITKRTRKKYVSSNFLGIVT